MQPIESMKPYHIITIVLTLLLLPRIYAQEPFTTNISGMVLDSAYHPIEYAAVQLFSEKDSSIRHGTITLPDGTYTIKNIELGKYLINVSAIGFQSFSDTINLNVSRKKTQVNLVQLKKHLIEIEEVNVVALKKGFTEKIDKTVFIPDTLTLGRAKTGIDVINSIPEVKVDKKDMSISIMGNKNVLVLINGIDNNRNIASISPQNIERIELITDPSVKYSSDVASVINIVLKGYKEKGLDIYSNAYIGLNKKSHMGYLQIDYHWGKYRFFVNYSPSFTFSENLDTTYRENISDPFYEYNTSLFSDNNANVSYNSIQYGFDYTLNKNNLFSFTSKLTSFNLNASQSNKVISYLNKDLFDLSNVSSEYKADDLQQNYSLFYKHNFKKENDELSVNINYYNFDYHSNDNILDSIQYFFSSDSIFASRTTDSKKKQNSINVKVDCRNSITPRIKLETGYQLYLRNIKNNTIATNTEESILAYLNYKNSFYANMIFNYDKYGFQAGMRYENFNVIVSGISHNQKEFLPFGTAFYQPNANNSFKLIYRETLDYPNISFLNPFTFYSSDSLTSYTGNPLLKPEIKHNLSLKYSYKKGDSYLSTNIYCNIINDIILQKAFLQNNILALKYENLGKAQKCGADISFSSVLFDVIEVEMQLRGNYTNFLSNDKTHNGFSYASELGIYTPLLAGFDLEIYGVLAEKEINYNGYRLSSGYIDEIAISKDITQNLYIGFSVWQPFFRIKDTYKQWGNTFTETNISTEINSTVYLFNLTYSFNSGKRAKKIDKESIMEDNSSNNRKKR